MYSQATVSPALMHSLGLPSGLPWLKVSRARVIGSLKRAESSPPLGCSPGKHGTLSCLQGKVERILTQTAPVSLVLAGGRRNQALPLRRLRPRRCCRSDLLGGRLPLSSGCSC